MKLHFKCESDIDCDYEDNKLRFYKVTCINTNNFLDEKDYWVFCDFCIDQISIKNEFYNYEEITEKQYIVYCSLE